MEQRLKVMTVLGTRPEIVRLSETIRLLDENCNHVLVHTGQNYDYELSQVFFEDLEVRRPDYFLEVDTSTLGRAYGNILISSEEAMLAEDPDAILILGDTNSAISAIIAKRLHIPVYHMEAGNRSFDENVPEELNRRIVDHIADFNLVYTERARLHLISEGLSHRRTYLTGSPLVEVFRRHKGAIETSDVIERIGLIRDDYFLVSIHREENVDDPGRLRQVLLALSELAGATGHEIVVSTHPRTRDRLRSIPDEDMPEDIRFLDAFGYHDYSHLQMSARCVISDSGSIAEESAIMGFPAITLRDSMERPEALDAGTIAMVGLESGQLVSTTRMQVRRWETAPPSIPDEYAVADCSERVVNLILSTAKLSHVWSGVRTGPPD